MDFSWLWGGSAWPAGIPRLYPQLNQQRLSQFLDLPEFQRVAQLPQVMILPLASKNSRDEDAIFGLGLQKLLIRDLMLVRNLSVRGPEDSPEAYLESVPQLREGRDRAIFVSGLAEVGQGWWRVELRLFAAGQQPFATTVQESDFGQFLSKVAHAIAHICRGEVTDQTRQMWSLGRPGSPQSLLALGELCASYGKHDTGRGPAALALWQRDPNLVVALHQLDDDDPLARRHYLQGHASDPFDAQLCFVLGLSLWQSRGPQPEVVQFLRRAIELSPGHGKAHMCAPHAAARGVNMILHSELGYRLLPGNPFAINNFILYLQQQGAPPARIIPLAREGIECDREDPGNYERLIEMCLATGDLETALSAAEQLQTLFEPEMSRRALYCLQQNPRMAEMLRTGQYNPAAINRQRILQMRRQLGR